ncbi:MAG: hypothetical protein M9909_00375 [Thermomicrobiales bacterium]|nr:hypothetical protein [Thermomicrobiales bacterium]
MSLAEAASIFAVSESTLSRWKHLVVTGQSLIPKPRPDGHGWCRLLMKKLCGTGGGTRCHAGYASGDVGKRMASCS